MEFSVSQLFEQLLNHSPIDLLALQNMLGITKPHQQVELDIALKALVRVGFLEEHGEPPTYKRQRSDTLVVGRLRCSSKGFCFAIRDEPGVEDIYIHGTNLNGAWNGDQVLARITKDGNRKRSPEGEVTAVIDRANPTIVGRIKQVEKGFRAVPLDDRLLFELELIGQSLQNSGIEISETDEVVDETDPEFETFQDDESTQLEDGQYAYIQVKQYPLANMLAIGQVRKVLGSSPETSMDTDLVCCMYDLPQHFSPELTAQGESLSYKITKSEVSKRQDFRDWLTVTVEPLDLQHPHSLEPNVAISLGADDDGWQLGVHIADVAHWLDSGHPLDQEALERAFTVYLDASVLPLFPPNFQSQVALIPEQERLTISVLLDLDAEGQLLSYEIHPGVILPRTHLTYGQVQTLLASANELREANEELPELMSLLTNLNHVAHILKQKRHLANGFELQMLDLLSPTSADEAREGALVISAGPAAHTMMSEFTFIANKAIGEHLHMLGVPGIYRIQPAPSADALQSFLRLAGNMRLTLGLATPDVVTSQDFQTFVRRIQAPDVVANGSSPGLTAQLLSTLPSPQYCLAPEDQLFGSLGGHFGLGLDLPYCHATAPLRRYIDLLNQRTLNLVFGKGRDRRSSRVKKGVDLRSSGCHGEINWKVLPPKTHDDLYAALLTKVEYVNQRQAVVYKAERELAGLKKSEFMQKHVGETFPGLIIGVQNYGFFVSIDPILAEGLVHVSSLKNDWYEYRSRQQALVGRKSRKQFRLGDRVEVRIKNVDYYRQQIDLEVVGEGRYYDEDETFSRDLG